MGLIEALREQAEVHNLQSHRTSWSAANCPECGERSAVDGDRLVIWPERKSGRGSFWCRKCGAKGDGIDLLRGYNPNLSYPDAYMAIKGTIPPDNWTITGQPPKTSATPAMKTKERDHGLETHLNALARESFIRRNRLGPPPPTPLPPADWQAEATAVWLEARERLLTDPAARTFLESRGLDPMAAWASVAFGWLPRATAIGRGWLAPGLMQVTVDEASGNVVCASVHLLRPTSNGEKHFWAKGIRTRSVVLRPAATIIDGQAVFRPRLALVMESALDAALAWQTSQEIVAVGVGSAAWFPDRVADDAISAAERIIVVPDLDESGRQAAERWRGRWPDAEIWTPQGGKDLGEAHAAALAGKPGAMTIDAWMQCVWNNTPTPSLQP